MSVGLYTAVTGLTNFQKMLDVVSNNIANVNTPGFKTGRVNFQELMSQTIRPASGPNTAIGGANAVQMGLGSTLGTIDSIMTQGVLDITGNPTDLAITGDGYFVVGTGQEMLYTRNGHFSADADGNIVDSGGRALKGFQADATGTVDSATAPQPLRIPFGESMTAQATTSARFTGNLDASAATYAAGPPETGGVFTTQVSVYDALGQDYRVSVKFTRAAGSGTGSTWDWTASDPSGTAIGNGSLAFDAVGNVDEAGSTAGTFDITPTNGADPISVTPDFGAVTQLVTPGRYSVIASDQDGFPAGVLNNFSIDRSGTIMGQYSNAMSRPLGQVALAYFSNPQGLEKASAGLARESANSGAPQLGSPGSSPRGELTSGALEMSNVELSTEFTRLITAQRAFQANSRVVSVMDEVLQEVSNLKR